jgi:hypothetical protein
VQTDHLFDHQWPKHFSSVSVISNTFQARPGSLKNASLNISPPHLVHLRHSAPLGRRLRRDIAAVGFDPLANSNRSIIGSSASSNQNPGASLSNSPGERESTPGVAMAVLVEVWGAIRHSTLLSEGGARYRCALRQSSSRMR